MKKQSRRSLIVGFSALFGTLLGWYFQRIASGVALGLAVGYAINELVIYGERSKK